MANNLKVGPNGAVAKINRSFLDCGFNDANCQVAFKVGNPLKPWFPGNSINAIDGFEVGDWGYYIVMKQPMDLSDVVAPPLPAPAVVSDDFNSANIANILGRLTPIGNLAWQRMEDVSSVGIIGIVSNVAKLTNTAALGSPGHIRYVVDTGSANVDARVTIGVIGNLNMVISGTNDGLNLNVDLTTGLVTQHLTGITDTNPIPASGTSVAGDIMRAVRVGTTLQIYRNATLIGTGTVSATLTGTKHGIFIYASDVATIDKFEIV